MAIISPTLSKVFPCPVEISLGVTLPALSKILARAPVAICPQEFRQEEDGYQEELSHGEIEVRGCKSFLGGFLGQMAF